MAELFKLLLASSAYVSKLMSTDGKVVAGVGSFVASDMYVFESISFLLAGPTLHPNKHCVSNLFGS